MLNKNSIQPLYKQLMDIIASQIKNGTYKPGEKIPTEPELAELAICCGLLFAGEACQTSGKGNFREVSYDLPQV